MRPRLPRARFIKFLYNINYNIKYNIKYNICCNRVRGDLPANINIQYPIIFNFKNIIIIF